MTGQFWAGVLVLPVTAVGLAVAAWLWVHVWDGLDTWWRTHKLRPVSELLSYDVNTRRQRLWLGRRAPMIVAFAAAPKLWTLRPVPGTFVVIFRDYAAKGTDEHEQVRNAVRDALQDVYLPTESGDTAD